MKEQFRLAILAAFCIASSALAERPASKPVDLFLEVNASNTEDLVALREKTTVADPERALWVKRSRPVFINWTYLEDNLATMRDQDVQVSLFEDTVCEPNTRILKKSRFNTSWTWAGSCIGSGFAGSLTIDPVRHKMVGNLRRVTSDGKVEMIQIARVGFNHGAVYELDVEQMPPPMPVADDTPRAR